MSDYTNKTIIVTGASQGLGKCIVENILQKYNGSQVVLVARNHVLLTSFFNNLKDSDKERVLIIKGDVTDEETINLTIEKTFNKFGKIDGIIFNAGIIEPVGHLYESNFDVDGMKKLFDVNFFSIVKFLNKLLPEIKTNNNNNNNNNSNNNKKKSINIIFVSSGASTRGIDGWLAYGTSKAAVNALCKQIHDEMNEWVNCVSIAPGVVDTEMQHTIREKFVGKMKDESYQNFINLHEKGQLLDGMVVGATYARLIVEGIPENVRGSYIRWDSL
jgi:NAD(P)-dependent dehydrogenase (short-subunit alcohol dehydrogenase family)